MLISLAEFIQITSPGFPPRMPHSPQPSPSITHPYTCCFFHPCPESLSPVRSPYISFGSLGYSGTHLVTLGENGYGYFFCGLLFDFWFCFGHIDKMHVISSTVETMNILFKNKIKKCSFHQIFHTYFETLNKIRH